LLKSKNLLNYESVNVLATMRRVSGWRQEVS